MYQQFTETENTVEFSFWIQILNNSSFVSCPSLCQGDDPLGSIHLRGSVVTAVEYVPDGRSNHCHMIYMHTVTDLNQEM